MPCHFAIFGAAGHVVRTKLLPALYDLEAAGCLDATLCFVALARRDWNTETWRKYLLDALEAARDVDARASQRFASRFEFLGGDNDDPELYRRLRDVIFGRRADGYAHAVFYLALPPAGYLGVVCQLAAAGLNDPAERYRIVLEKPFGHDLSSARRLNAELHRHYRERQIFRIDHYLGKETVQNLFVFRLANAVVEPLWNRHYVQHVEITAAEDAGLEGRAGYFDHTGTLRDMVQSHLLQVLAFVAMEPPASLDPDDLRDEKAKVLRSVRPLSEDEIGTSALRAQYVAGEIAGRPVPGYRQEIDVRPDSTTETYVALKLKIDNWRWRGVRFYLRSGKRLRKRRSFVAIRFRDPPQQLFSGTACANPAPNWLTLSIQPKDTIRFELQARAPGFAMTPRPLSIATANEHGHEPELDAYAALLLDIVEDDRSLFIRFDEVEAAWQIVEPVLESFAQNELPLHNYAAGEWGPRIGRDRLGDPARWRNRP